MAEEEKDKLDDETAVNEYISRKVKENVAEFMKEYQPQQQVKSEPDDDITRGRKALKDAIDPIYGPDINTAKFTADAAMDYVDFYTSNPDASERKSEIENIFQNAAKAGKPLSRDSINKYLVGQDYLKDPDKFMQSREEKKKLQLQRARDAEDMVEGSRLKADKFDNFASKTIEEMEAILADVEI
jgi:hypothetical protein